ncbi:hypothetical protein Taro_045252 [Colocasia esculenta]|uniref:Uncharacterized protein n=1 Tax=Colocasia esculenta TaxID=4460 RepID=A0A843X4H6_COLES|nr:hypothetical protein [Colocasia esculenta]
MASHAVALATGGGAIEVYKEGADCRRRLVKILKENSLPTGLLPFDDGIMELGYNKDDGFIWMKQKEKKQHYFPKAKLTVVYEAEVAAYLQPSGMKKIKGVAAKELFLKINAEEFSVDGDPIDGSIHVKTTIGISRVLPASAFQLEA